MSDSYDFLARQPSAVDSAFAVLEAVARIGPGVTARQLVDDLPMSRAGVYRVLKHLVANEYLVRTPDLRGFVIGERVAALGRARPVYGRTSEVSRLEEPSLDAGGTLG